MGFLEQGALFFWTEGVQSKNFKAGQSELSANLSEPSANWNGNETKNSIYLLWSNFWRAFGIGLPFLLVCKWKGDGANKFPVILGM